jgi:hypothetical protein
MTHTATDLGAIVRATRASANALARMQRYGAKLGRLGTHGNLPELRRAYRNAERAYHRAQSILADNPLPGDVGMRPGDAAAVMRDETSIPYADCLRMTNTD